MFCCIAMVCNNNTYQVFLHILRFLIKPEIATNLSLCKVCKTAVNLSLKSEKWPLILTYLKSVKQSLRICHLKKQSQHTMKYKKRYFSKYKDAKFIIK